MASPTLSCTVNGLNARCTSLAPSPCVSTSSRECGLISTSCHARASIRPSNSFGPTSVRPCPNSILRCPNYTELSFELSICLVRSFVYNLLIVLDFAISNYPELLDLLLVSFPLAPLSRSQIPSLAYTGPELSSPFRNPPVSHHRCSSFNPMMIDS